MHRIFLSLALITIICGSLTLGATRAFFSDTETSVANTFTAGAIDLLVDNESYYNGVFNPNTSWTQTDLTIEKFFDFDDVKPNDYGEDTISFHVDTNAAYLCANIELTSNDENGCTEPEGEVDGSCDDPGFEQGELPSLINFLFWADDGDNVLETDEEDSIFFASNATDIGDIVTLADSDENVWTGVGGPIPGDETVYVAKAWCFGDIAADPIPQDGLTDAMTPADDNDGDTQAGTPADGGFACDGTGLGNESQTDSLTADITFEAVQARNNEGFQCEPPAPVTRLTLIKELFSPVDAPSDWTLSAAGPTSFSGVANSADVTNIEIDPGTYDLSEAGPGNYNASVWNCVGGTVDDADTVTIAEGEDVTCTVINYISCVNPSLQYADRVVSVAQGVRNNGTAINADRTDPNDVLGAPQSSGDPADNPVPVGEFFSLGFNADQSVNMNGGQITIEFVDNFLVDGPGNDLRMWEVTGGTDYPVEKLKIEVSQDNSSWFEVESSVDRDAEADLANSGLAWARYVRLTDVSDRTEFEATADAYDLDAFSALTCADRSFISDPD